MKSAYEEIFEIHLLNFKIPFVREYKFHRIRKWKFDFVILPIECRIAVEIEGAVWTQGRHTRGSGYVKDLEKYNTAAIDGWKVIRFTGAQVKNFEAIELIKKLYDSLLVNNA